MSTVTSQKRFIVRWSLLLVAALAGFALGSLWKRHSAASAASHSRSALPSTAALSAASRSPQPVLPSTLAGQLQQQLRNASPQTKWLCWVSALEKATTADFPHLLKVAAGDKAASRFVMKRWIEVAPRAVFDAMVAASRTSDNSLLRYTRELLTSWVKRDPDAVISALNDTPNLGIRKELRMQIADAVFDQNPERGLQLMSAWGISNYGPNMKSVKAWAGADPQYAAEFTLTHPTGYASQLVIEAIGKEWAAAAPAAGLTFALSQSGDLASRLSSSLLKEWASRDLQAAAGWLSQADPSRRAELSAAFVEIWGKQDAAAALAWCQDNLEGIPLFQAISGVVRGAAAKDLHGAAVLVTQLEPGEARAEAANAVVQKWFPPDWNAIGAPKPEQIQWLGALDDASIKNVLRNEHWRWERADAPSLATFLSTVNSDAVPERVDSSVARTWALTHPEDTLAWAAKLPEARGLEAGGTAFEVWREAQPDQAMQWLNALPPEDPRRAAYFEKMLRSLANLPQGAQQLAAMSPTDQAAAQAILAKISLPEDARSKLQAALKK